MPLAPCPCRGFSLIELILFILIVSVALVVIVKAFEMASLGSADPVLRRQSLAIAQALVEEISYKPFNDLCQQAGSGVTAGCFSGAATAASRGQFDDVMDYNGLVLSPITDLANAELVGLGNYSARVAVANAAYANVPLADAYRITVRVTDPRGEVVTLETYRANF